MKDIYSCWGFDNQAEAAGSLYVQQLMSDPDKQKSSRVSKPLLQLGDMPGVQHAVVA
jgi:hypothetical protein